ncbi:MAG: hypothetical protein KGI75_02920 [Rhizobiaceae bacterium]|nr:hypothetical protein [Rhizobiaceae bacterium]
MLPENITAIVTRNETWSGKAASEPYEVGWAKEAILFVRALKAPVGAVARAWIEISPDGMHWIPEGTTVDMPVQKDGLAAARVAHFGNWLRLAAEFDNGSSCAVLVTLHLKA